MVARTGYFSYKDVREVLYNFDCNNVNKLKQIHPRKYADLIICAPGFPKNRFWSPLRADDLLAMNGLQRKLIEMSIIEGNHMTKFPLEIIDYILKICLQSTPLMCELWRIYIGSPGLRDSRKLQRQRSSEQDFELSKIPYICEGNQSLNEASKMLLIIYGEKPLKRDDPLSYFKQLLHYVFKVYFNRFDYQGKRKVLEKFSHILPINELEQILKITQDPKQKLQKLNEVALEIRKNVSFIEYLSIRRTFVIYYFFLIKIYATTNLVIFCLLALAFLAVFITGVALLYYRYLIVGIIVIGFGFPLVSVYCLLVFDKYSEPQFPPSAMKPLEEMIDKFVREQLVKTIDRQLPALCEKWERVVLDLMPYVSHIQKIKNASFLY